MAAPTFLGIDVGTGSARAGLFDTSGALLGCGSVPIATHRPRETFAQQASADIWRAVVAAVRAARAEAGDIDVAALAFDATCSLVVSGPDGAVSVDPDGAPEQDVVLWMDHRAVGEAHEINGIGGEPLARVGGAISPEMQMPKLLWLKRNLPEAWRMATAFRDLPDWLVHRATGTDARSVNSLVCKWGYLGERGLSGEGWDDGYLSAIGLADLAEDGHARLGTDLILPGRSAGTLSEAAADELDLAPGLPVAAGMIDAYAGALGTLGAQCEGDASRGERLALIAGTSACHIVETDSSAFVPGIWGPYPQVLTPGRIALEAGQSAAGALLDAVIARHGASAGMTGGASGAAVALSERLDALAPKGGLARAELTRARHVQPDFHGNRAPLADPERRGMITGLTLETGMDDLALDYLAAIQSLAYGTRAILDAMAAQGLSVSDIVMSGGLATNADYVAAHADATGCRVLVPEGEEPVLRGVATAAAVAAGAFGTLTEGAAAMAGPARAVHPSPAARAYHDRKYAVFTAMQAHFDNVRRLMAGEGEPEMATGGRET
ncbi:FGGY family pentulose kinase [uncultured Jannaschia sp.]|uniref:FGGY-family carbohydrate kinase n=1 Tax=uncultured Jannaschia sp. TaxID=293347 RepID=UPI00262F7EBC|nr:FGGY family pentulose kinase [uncultured Jannaschia sp.]